MEEFLNQLFGGIEVSLEIVPRVVEGHILTLKGFEESRIRWKERYDELNEDLAILNSENEKLHKQLNLARKLIDEEKSKRKQTEKIKDRLEFQLNHLIEALKNIHHKVPEFAEHENFFVGLLSSSEFCSEINNNSYEAETTGSFMADLSYTRDEEDFLVAGAPKNEIPQKKKVTKEMKKIAVKRSSSAVRACELKPKDFEKHYTGTNIGNDNSIVPQEILVQELGCKKLLSKPKEPFDRTPKSLGQPFSININNRPHNFQQKSMLKCEICNVCSKRLKFSSLGYKCRDCKMICHIMCKYDAPLLCLQPLSTPCKTSDVEISDLTPLVPPMVPSFVICCIKEIEERGLKKPGLYLISGSDKDIKAVREKFTLGKEPNLTEIQEIHVICGSLKHFFRSLKEPLTTKARWNDFAQAVHIEDIWEKRQKLYEIVSELPQPNRETLAYLLLHLQKIVESKDCKMRISHLANVFGPTIIGYSCEEPENVYGETMIANKVMDELLNLPKKFLEGLINKQVPNNILSTPKDTWSPKWSQRKTFFNTPIFKK